MLYFHRPTYKLLKVLENKEKSGIKPDLFILAEHTVQSSFALENTIVPSNLSPQFL